MNNSSVTTTTICRKCKKMKSCLKTLSESNYTYLCTDCAKEENLVSSCRSCGREGLSKEMKKHGGYCHICEGSNIHECSLCGKEAYSHKINGDVCTKCSTGKNKQCLKCGTYMSSNKINSEGLCDKCTIEIYNTLKGSKVNEVVECIECGREVYVNDQKEGLCLHCYTDVLVSEISKLNKKIKRKRAYN